MNPLDFNVKAAELIQNIGNSLQELKNSGDVGSCVDAELEQLDEFMATYKKPSAMFDSPIRKMLEEKDRYSCVAISTAALTCYDQQLLAKLEYDSNMVMGRDFGWFIKLYEETDALTAMLGEVNDDCYNLHKILLNAHQAGYRMVEFDSDAQLYCKGYDDGR